MIPLLSLALAACLSVGPDSDHVTARDLVQAYPEMASLDPATPLAYAPAPGVSRVFHAADWRSLAARFHLAQTPEQEICVERPVAALEPGQLLAAMKVTLPAARIEILEYSRQPAPAGQIAFPRHGLRHETVGDVAMWNGWIRYAGNRLFMIWARVRVTETVQRVLAIGDLPAERAIAPGQVVLQTHEEFPQNGSFAGSVEQVWGKWSRAAIRAGTAIRTDQLSEPREVARGETVRVDAIDGAAHLAFEGVAESSGALGQVISVCNPVSHRRFRARVEGKGRVSVNGNSSKVIP